MSRRLVQLALATSVVVAVFFVACGPPPPNGNETLVIVGSPLTLASDGSPSTLTITAKDAAGGPGAGMVSLSAPAGSLAAGGRTATLTLGANGTITTTFTCDKAVDSACNATSVRIDASWVVNTRTVTSFTNISLTGGGGGMDGGGDGGNPGGDGGSSSGGLSIVSNRSPIFTDVGDFAVLTATLKSLPDGGGSPVPGAAINFSTNIGTLGPADGGTSTGLTYSEVTNASGQAFTTLRAGSTGGVATVRADNAPGPAVASTTVSITDIRQISFTSATCGAPTACTLMGIRGSGKNETATLTFTVTDTNMLPAARVPVTFTLGTGAPLGATVSPNGITDGAGRVQATLQSGSGIGVVSVTATVFPPIQASSTGIGITGARVSNAGISLVCSEVNIPAYVSPAPPRDITVNCSVRLTDRYTNAIGFPTTVNFVAEAGTVSTSVLTTGFNTMNPGDPNIGKATFTFSTRGGTGRAFPVDVPPLAAAAGQDPLPRLAEPSYASGSLTLNPRDGLATIVADVNGEEYFYDANGNGSYDNGEQVYDQGERLVDANDNGVFDLGENFFDENNNGVWNGPDGVYQSDKQVWTEYRLLYTGLPETGHIDPHPFSGPCGMGLPKGGQVQFALWDSDQNLNVTTGGTGLSLIHTSTKGTTRLNGATTLVDTYGFSMDRQLFNPTTGRLCQPADPICHFKTQFYDWSGGLLATTATLIGASTTDSSPCQGDTVTLNVTILGVLTGLPSTGAVE